MVTASWVVAVILSSKPLDERLHEQEEDERRQRVPLQGAALEGDRGSYSGREAEGGGGACVHVLDSRHSVLRELEQLHHFRDSLLREGPEGVSKIEVGHVQVALSGAAVLKKREHIGESLVAVTILAETELRVRKEPLVRTESVQAVSEDGVIKFSYAVSQADWAPVPKVRWVPTLKEENSLRVLPRGRGTARG
jgi:hypothetical protein